LSLQIKAIATQQRTIVAQMITVIIPGESSDPLICKGPMINFPIDQKITIADIVFKTIKIFTSFLLFKPLKK